MRVPRAVIVKTSLSLMVSFNDESKGERRNLGFEIGSLMHNKSIRVKSIRAGGK